MNILSIILLITIVTKAQDLESATPYIKTQEEIMAELPEVGSNRYAIIGSPYEPIIGTNDNDNIEVGAAYIYERTCNGTWNLVQKLQGTQSNARFGFSVGISNEYAVVGAYTENNDIGAVYIYEKTCDKTWKLVKHLKGNYIGDKFGIHVEILNDEYVIVNTSKGMENIYQRSSDGTWNLVQKAQKAQNTQNINKQYSWNQTPDQSVPCLWNAAISNRYAITGFIHDTYNESGSFGAAYIYERSSNRTWILSQKIKGEHGEFGAAVKISNKYAIIGSVYETSNDADILEAEGAEGAVYIYERALNGNWNLAQKIQSTSTKYSSYFGRALGLSNEYIIVSAYQENDNTGAAYIYERLCDGTWNLAQKFEGTQIGSCFGFSVGISNKYAIVGAWRENNDTGAVYIYEQICDGTWNLVQKFEGTQSGSHFGYNVGISNQYIIVSSWDIDTDTGAAYIYQRTSIDGIWNLAQKITGTGTVNGWTPKIVSVEISNKYALVSVPYNETVYIYRRNMINGSWIFSQKLESIYFLFGFSIGISPNGTLFITTHQDVAFFYDGY